MGWDELQIDTLIKTCRKKLNEELGTDEPQFPLFENPAEDNPVETSEFLSHLHLGFLDGILRELFPRLERIKPEVYARVRLVLFMKLQGIRYITEVYRILQTKPTVAENLGFDPCHLPSYETIRHFINDLLADMVDDIFYRVVREIDRYLAKHGETLKQAREDATVITARRGDATASYSGYYKTWGWKKDLMVSDQGIFLSYKDLGINDDEGRALSSHLEVLQDNDIRLDSLIVDGGYPSYRNIALAHCRYRTSLLYKPQQHWTYNEKGSPMAIRERYSRYWRDKRHRPNVDTEYMLQFLYTKQEYERVGAYFRNHQVHRYQANEHLRDEIAQGRNQSEGFNSYLKQRVGFECMLPRKGAEHAFFHTTLCLLSVNMVALTRLQNGVTENLASVAYLT